MALINHSTVMSGLIQHIRDVVGARLSNLPVADAAPALPSVIRDRAKGPRPNFPYVVVDRQTSSKTQGAWLRYEEAVETAPDTYELNLKTEQTLGLTITCYGEDADDILNQLRVSLVDDVCRNKLNVLTGAVFQYFTDTDESPIFIETDFIDGASMTAYFTAVSVLVPTESSIIETVKGDGQFEVKNPHGDNHIVDEKVIHVDINFPIGE